MSRVKPSAAPWRDDARFCAAVQSGFERKVYVIVAAQLLVTTAVSALFMYHGATRDFVLRSSWGGTIATLATFGFLSGTQIWTVGTLCAILELSGLGGVVFQAVVLTAAATMGLTVYTLRSKRDFSLLGASLHAGLSVLVWGGLANMVLVATLGSSAVPDLVSLALSLGGACVFAGYICYDTYLLANRLGPDDYIAAASALYIDIVNFFMDLVRITFDLQRRRCVEVEEEKNREDVHSRMEEAGELLKLTKSEMLTLLKK
ncbi:inhibitor of apoptosis-promoting Bax1-domain-containing protein [Pavlovales sp. CCMP2436]|nr:inhibitor of apoptosis-promoting Bax1-domain-containing protein [Pavlovales sp. CCMP2436]